MIAHNMKQSMFINHQMYRHVAFLYPHVTEPLFVSTGLSRNTVG